jgi:hypothetical protein
LGFNRFGRQLFERLKVAAEWDSAAQLLLCKARTSETQTSAVCSQQRCTWRGKKQGTSGRMPVDRTIRLWSMAALFASALAIGGCSTQIADMPGVGVPTDAPQRPKEAGAYLPVHDLPPDREEAAMKPAELAKIQAELTAARDRQASTGAAAKTGTK